MMFTLTDPIATLPATRPATIKIMQSMGIQTFRDLLDYYPFRYENYTVHSPISRLQEGETVTITGKVMEMKNQYARRITIQKALISDETGTAELTWFNQPYLTNIFKVGATVSVAGIVQKRKLFPILEPKEYEVIKYPGQPLVHTGRMVPVYPEKRGLSTRTIRDKIAYLIKTVVPHVDPSEIDWLPEELREKYGLIGALEAYLTVHNPTNQKQLATAQKRLGFNEMFTIQLSSALIKQSWKKETVGNPFKKIDQNMINKFIDQLPFTLTKAQNRVIDEMIKDMKQTAPMNRFVQGDVGSGKTVVAAVGCFLAYLNGYQSLVMAPTEILANQHYKTISNLVKDYPISIGLQTGNVKMLKTSKKQKPEHYDILIGTHALISKDVNLKKVGLVVIDEQHRFGVAQRAMLKQKGLNPHLLTMTATPIPRTVALTIYGELDLSVIDEMPKGRLPIKTYLVPQGKRTDAYKWIKERIKKEKSQVFIICPLIEESEIETMQSVKAAKQEFERLRDQIFPEYKVGLLHGKMKAAEKDEVMNAFKNKHYDILVSTSVVEVGIDVPNASVMMIEGTQRFGLAQLHQLRGRVGRGAKQSYCLLFTDSEDPAVKSRLTFFAKTLSGIKLAEYDLKLRGPGSIYGMQQHGFQELKIASFSDLDLIKSSKSAVDYFMERYKIESFPPLWQHIQKYRIDQVARD